VHRLADVGIPGELHDRPDDMIAQDIPDELHVAQIALDERAPAHCRPVTVDEIVQRNGRMACRRQCLARAAADISGAAGDEDVIRHGAPVVDREMAAPGSDIVVRQAPSDFVHADDLAPFAKDTG